MRVFDQQKESQASLGAFSKILPVQMKIQASAEKHFTVKQ